MNEVDLSCKLARTHSLVDVADALAYMLVKLIPSESATYGSVPVNVALVIDISGSMKGAKINNAKAAAKMVVDSLRPVDTVSVTIFSDEARAIVPSTLVTDKQAIAAAIDRIRIVGGTRLYHGLDVAARQMQGSNSKGNINRMIILTDGETEGEEHCLAIGQREAGNRISVTAFGVGDSYNEEFLKQLSDLTMGSYYHLKNPEQTASHFYTEMQNVSESVITDVRLSLNLASEVKFEQMHRIYPNMAKVEPDIQDGGSIVSAHVGNLSSSESSVFGVQLKLPARPPGRVRVSQVFASYNIPGKDIEDGLAKQDVVVEYTSNKDLCGRVDKEVISYFNQLTVQTMINKAMKETKAGNISAATQSLSQAKQFTQRIGNVPLTRSIDDALDELQAEGNIKPGTIKDVRAGSSQTVIIEDEENEQE